MRGVSARARLLADADHERVEVRGAQPRAQAIELGEIGDRADAHAMPHVVVDRDALHVGVDALQLELRADAIGLGLLAIASPPAARTRPGRSIVAGALSRSRETSRSFSGTTTSKFGSMS